MRAHIACACARTCVCAFIYIWAYAEYRRTISCCKFALRRHAMYFASDSIILFEFLQQKTLPFRQGSRFLNVFCIYKSNE
ncbi:MAG TPA: hypothetical protein DEF02_02770 [Clostridiales bacterium]|nr:hypothetical protein [Clostridiales bacterium]HBW05500.1 hypothetical protein [Clostridiales bacterium]HCH92576.1 hypothetical protein [Clostridiales bacterium]